MKNLKLLSLWLLLMTSACKTGQPFCKQKCRSVVETVKEGWIVSNNSTYNQVSRRCLERFTNSFEKSLLDCSKKSVIREKDILFLLGEPDSILPYAHSYFRLGENYRNLDVKSKLTLCYRCESERKYLNEKDTFSAAIRTYYFLIDAKSKGFNGVFSTGLK